VSKQHFPYPMLVSVVFFDLRLKAGLQGKSGGEWASLENLFGTGHNDWTSRCLWNVRDL